MSTDTTGIHVTDEDIVTTFRSPAPPTASVGPQDADGVDGDGTDGTDGDSGDDADGTDGTDGDSGDDADGTDA